MKITIYSLPPSLNQYMRSHWAVKKRWRLRFGKEICVALIEAGGYTAAENHVRVDIIIFRPRRFDTDNCCGGLKPLIDSMRDIGIIKNDSPQWLDLRFGQIVERKNPRVEIEIT